VQQAFLKYYTMQLYRSDPTNSLPLGLYYIKQAFPLCLWGVLIDTYVANEDLIVLIAVSRSSLSEGL
jgi:hypothetical protein